MTGTATAAGPGSFEEFYASAARRLVTQLYLVTGDVEEARDCVQEAFARAWLRWGELHAGSDPFAWVYTVGYRIAVSRFRRRVTFTRLVRLTPPPAAMPGPTPEATAVRDALSTLPHPQRAALVLYYYQGLTVEEIAPILGVTPSAVKSRLSRGRAALAPLLADEQPDREEVRHD
jgi:RNA polymerase sigma-70 factor (ECF subfamily)